MYIESFSNRHPELTLGCVTPTEELQLLVAEQVALANLSIQLVAYRVRLLWTEQGWAYFSTED